MRAQHEGALALIDTLQRAKCLGVAMHRLGVLESESDPNVAVRALLDGQVDDDALARQLYFVYCALVYVAIEGWLGIKCDWDRFNDPIVDALIDAADLGVLRRFRNAVWHPAAMTDKRQIAFLDAAENELPRYSKIVDAMVSVIVPLAAVAARVHDDRIDGGT